MAMWCILISQSVFVLCNACSSTASIAGVKWEKDSPKGRFHLFRWVGSPCADRTGELFRFAHWRPPYRYVFVECVLHQLLAISFSLFIGMYKEHFNEFVAQPHKGSDFSFPVTDDVKLYGKKVLLSYQRFVKLYILFLPGSGVCCGQRLPRRSTVRHNLVG